MTPIEISIPTSTQTIAETVGEEPTGVGAPSDDCPGGKGEIVTASAAEPVPFPAPVTLTSTTNVPTSSGTHTSWGLFSELQPGGRPLQLNANGAVPPSSTAVTFIGAFSTGASGVTVS